MVGRPPFNVGGFGQSVELAESLRSHDHNVIVVVMIPDYDRRGLLPPGIHDAKWDEVATRFGGTTHRIEQLRGLRLALEHLGEAGCERVYLDGSFVTDKGVPNDYDVCWEMGGVTISLLTPVLRDVRPPRAAQQALYRGDILPNVIEASSGAPLVDFFQKDKATGGAKGIVAISLKELM